MPAKMPRPTTKPAVTSADIAQLPGILDQIRFRPGMFIPLNHPVVMHLLFEATRNAAESYGGKKGMVEATFNESNGEVLVRDYGAGMKLSDLAPIDAGSTTRGFGIPIIVALSDYCTISSFRNSRSKWTRRYGRTKSIQPQLLDEIDDARVGTLIAFKPKDEYIKAYPWVAQEAARVLAGQRPEFPNITFTIQAVRTIDLIP